MRLHRDIERAAATWMVRREQDGWSESEQAELEAWLSVSSAHRVAFIRLQSTWAEAGGLKVLAASGLVDPKDWRGEPAAEPDRAHSPPIRGYGRRLLNLSGTAIAAGLVLAIGLGSWLGWPRHETVYRTAIGGLSAIRVRDGSTITLNTDSGIHIELSDTERRVDLDKGEAFFQVAKDPNRPFIVRVGDDRVVAVGTQFSVRREQNVIHVIVTEGRVRVEHSTASNPPETAMIAPGGVAVAGVAGLLVQDKPLADVEERLSWRKGMVVFHDTLLTDAVAEFNRYNTRKIDIQDADIGAIRIAGRFRTNNAPAFARLLASAFPIQIESNDEKIVLRRR